MFVRVEHLVDDTKKFKERTVKSTNESLSFSPQITTTVSLEEEEKNSQYCLKEIDTFQRKTQKHEKRCYGVMFLAFTVLSWYRGLSTQVPWETLIQEKHKIHLEVPIR